MQASADASTTREPRVMILGSCVSRDIFEIQSHGLALAGYLARTSMAGFGLERVVDEEVRACAEGLQSAFQRGMAINDLDKSTLGKIMEVPHDFILIDLIDERFRLVRAGRSLFSLSGELEKAGFDPGTRDIILPDSVDFQHLWLAGFERFLAAVGTDKVILNKAFWATRSNQDETVLSRSWVERNNGVLGHLYDMIEKHWSLMTIEYPEGTTIADASHRWGVAPYHYVESMYRHAATAILGFYEAKRLA